MHPGLMYWWKARQAGGDCGWAEAACGSGDGGGDRHERWHRRHQERHAGHAGGEGWGGGDDFGGGAFGVRRPLRFLAYKLELDESQVAQLARILDELKTERAQGEV